MLRNQLNRARRAPKGLTLIELIVVLTILVALGGLLTPVIANALTRSHVATCSVNIPETYKALLLRQTTVGDLGDGWTTGVFGAGTGAGEAVNDSAASAFGGGGSGGLDALVGTLTAAEAVALNEAGINTVFNHGDPATVPDYNVTFNPGLTGVALDDSTPVIILDTAAADAIYLPSANGERYVWLGLDVSWTGIGTSIGEPPVHFGDTPGALPHEVYSRFGAVFQVGDAGGTFPSAQLRTVTYNIEGEAATFETAGNHIGIHWQEVHAG